MECMGVASGCGEQEAGVASGSGWNLCVATGCGCKEVYRFPHTTYPYSSCISSFYSSIPTFCSFLKMFFVLVPVVSSCNLYYSACKAARACGLAPLDRTSVYI